MPNPSDYGVEIRFTDAQERRMDLVANAVSESNRRTLANIDADLQGKPLPYPPPEEHEHHCPGCLCQRDGNAQIID